MSDFAIKVNNISKLYRIGLEEQSHDTLVSTVFSLIKSPFNNLLKLKNLTRFSNNQGNGNDIIKALDNVSFEVKKGDVFGIIGPNGAGKSTLLKIIAKISHPNSGFIAINGTIASLLEVGTGFHPELTGRENIYLNGTILGMTKIEIKNKFQEIVQFSGIEKFIDTPVKRYSSGMRVRLAFSVAAHLDPDILLIDEVLAVGDSDFRKKAMGKINEISANNNRTIMFVSHNMAAISTICNKAMLLKNGKIDYIGDKEDAIYQYLNRNKKVNLSRKWTINDAPGGDKIKFLEINILPKEGDKINISSGIIFEFVCMNYLKNSAVDISFDILSQDGILIIHHGHLISEPKSLKPGKYKLEMFLPPFLLNRGTYFLNVFSGLSGHEKIATIDNHIRFEVHSSAVDLVTRDLPGLIRPIIKFKSSFFSN